MPGSASAMLSRTVALSSTFSCSTTPICRRSQAGSITAVSTPSTSTRPSFRHVEPLQQLGQCALAGAGGADDADHLAGADLQADVLQHHRPVEAVAEADMLELHRALDRRQRGAAGAGGFRRGVEDVAQPLDRQPRLVEILPELGEPQHRLADALGQHVEGDQFAHRHVACRSPPWRRNTGSQRGDQLADELDGLAGAVAERWRPSSTAPT